MFERYTEAARRSIFFARYEASQLGGRQIETEHLLLGLLRENKATVHRFLTSVTVPEIRAKIETHSTRDPKLATSVDLPLSEECRRVLAYATEEAERLAQRHIGGEHLLLGLLREESGYAALLLGEYGIHLAALRLEMAKDEETYFFAYSATLRISGDIPNMDAISAVLGVQPTRIHRKGDSGLIGSPYQHDMWSYTPSVDRSEPLHRHIDALWVKLKPHREYLLELKKSANVDVFLGYRSDCETAGIEVPHTSLQMFSELEVPFGLSIVVS